jgi:hypothetical protein
VRNGGVHFIRNSDDDVVDHRISLPNGVPFKRSTAQPISLTRGAFTGEEVMAKAKAKSEVVKAAQKAAAAAGPVGPASTEMVFESQDFRRIPGGVKQTLFKILVAGDFQSASLGVVIFEQASPASPFVVLAKQEVDNLAATPEQSFVAFAPISGARYVITFVGEMHALTLSKDPLVLALAVTADGVGQPIEDFKGPQKVDGRFCAVRGRALLEA